MPSLASLQGEPDDGYEAARAFAYSEHPVSWFVEQDSQFTPPLLTVGMLYDIVATTPVDARLHARERFVADLREQRLPLPLDAVQAEITS
jgi:hypothetical protein